MGFDTGIWECATCGQTVSRLLGMAGVVELHEGGVRIRPVVRGYCGARRDAVRQTFVRELERVGTIQWLGEPDVELRPRNALVWITEAEMRFASSMPGGRGFSRSKEGRCPHCCGDVAWGTGPHADDDSVRPGCVPWVCTNCRAAGVAYFEP